MKSFRYQTTSFGGIRKDVSDGYHAQDSLNLLTQAGRVRKRHGYRQILSFGGAVRGIADVYLEGLAYRLVYADKRFWLREASLPDEQASYQDVTLSGNVDADRLRDTPVSFYPNGGKVYVLGCGDYLVLSLSDGRPLLNRVEDGQNTYIPTTRVGITAIGASEYVPQTVDSSSVGDWWIESGDGYEMVHLDANHPPQEGVTYYRRIMTDSSGVAMDKPNLLSTYRINTLYGGGEGTTVYQLDAPSIDRDGAVSITVNVAQGERVRTYRLSTSSSSTVERALRKGDDMSGRTLYVAGATTTSATLHLLPSRIGLPYVVMERGSIYWQADGITSSDWNDARLVVHTPLGDTTIATATRSSLTSPYTVTYTQTSLSMGDVGAVTAVVNGSYLSALLPRLTENLTYAGQTVGSIDFEKARLTLTMDTTPAGSFDNITVKYRYRPTEYNADLVTTAQVSTVWGVDGRQDRLFVADLTRGVDYHSASEDWTYFADQDTTSLGDGVVKGYLPIGDNTLATMTDSPHGHNLFVRKGSWREQTVTVGGTSETIYSALFPIVGSWRVKPSHDVGFHSFAGGVVYTGEEGVYRLTYNALSQEGKARLIGRCPISPISSCVHQGRLYLADEEGVWSLDSGETYRDEGEELCELSRLNVPHISCWFASGDTLGFGTLDGRMCIVDTGYEDVTFQPLGAGELTLDGQGDVVVDSTLDIPLGSRLILETPAYYPLATAEAEEGTCYLLADDVDRLYEGDVVYVGGNYDPYVVASIDWAKCTATLQGETPLPDGAITLLGNAQDQPLDWEREGNVLTLTRADGREVHPTALVGVAVGRWETRQAVKAYWVSQTLTLGRADEAKIVQRTSVTFRTAKRAGATISLTNGSTVERYALKGMGQMDLDDLSYERMSYEGDYWQSHTRRLKMRAHHLVCRLESDRPASWELGSLVIAGIVPDKQRGGVNG